jgi:uncharacterized protein YdhG (YjbR/CyaY superfamily)
MSDQSKEIDSYLNTLPDGRREALTALRSWIHETLPNAQDVIEYGIPGVYQDALICSYKSQKNYMSLYMDVEIVENHKAELDEAGLNCGKSCIRFRHLEQLPEETIKTMLRETAEKQALEQQTK